MLEKYPMFSTVSSWWKPQGFPPFPDLGLARRKGTQPLYKFVANENMKYIRERVLMQLMASFLKGVPPENHHLTCGGRHARNHGQFQEIQ